MNCFASLRLLLCVYCVGCYVYLYGCNGKCIYIAMRKPTFFNHTDYINFLYSNLFTIIFLYCVQLEPFFDRFLFSITIVVCLFILYIVLWLQRLRLS